MQQVTRRAARKAVHAGRQKHVVQTGAQANAAAPEAPITDMDKFRADMAQRLCIIMGNMLRHWRDCPERCCRRARRCLSPRILCSHPMPGPEPSEEQIMRTKALMYRMLQEGVARPGDVLPANLAIQNWNFPLMIPLWGRGEFHEGIEVFGIPDCVRFEAG